MNKSTDFTILDLINIFKENRKLILIITSAFTVVGIVYSLIVDPLYTSTLKILPSGNQKTPSIFSQFAGLASNMGINLSDNISNFNIYPEIIKSNFILDKILANRYKSSNDKAKISLYNLLKIDFSSLDPEAKKIAEDETKSKLRDSYINAEIEDKSGILKIDVTVPLDPVLSAEIANSLFDYLKEYNNNYRKYRAHEQIKYIKKSITNTKKRLDLLESKSIDFQLKNIDLSSPIKKMAFDKIQSEIELERNIYEELEKQKKLAELELIKEIDVLNVIEKAIPPVKRSFPSRKIIVVIFFLFGFLSSHLTIFIMQVRNLYSE